jgi:DNA replication protein DnaC
MTEERAKKISPNVFDTGKICPNCGEHIFAYRFPMSGRVFECPCSCKSAEVRKEDARIKSEKKADARKARFTWANIPRNFAGAKLNNYHRLPGTESAFSTVKDYLLNRQENIRDGSGLILYGPTGCGKTHLACAVLSCVLEDGYRAAYWCVPQMLEMLMPGGDEGEQQMILDKALLSRVLLLDDLGAEKPSEWTRKELTIILDARWRENRPTIVTTNLLPGEELRRDCGDRAYSRLMSDHYQVVPVTAEDYRRAK